MQNIVAAFDRTESAQRAYDQLRSAGVPAAQLHLQLAPGAEFMSQAGPSQPALGDADYQHQGVLASLGGLFANLLESHTDESGIYSDALRPGSSLLAVRALDPQEARNAATVLRDCGASHVDEHVARDRREMADTGQDPTPARQGAAPAAGAHVDETAQKRQI